MRYSALCPSPLGDLTLVCDPAGQALAGLWLEGQAHFLGSLAQLPPPQEDLPVFQQTRRWLERYFAGERPSPADVPLAPDGTPFQQQVWALLRQIPYGRVTTYGALGSRLSAQRGLGRAIGGAVGRNPISILIPCHRVVGAGGRLTGYAGGLDKKRWLLKHEGVALTPAGAAERQHVLPGAP